MPCLSPPPRLSVPCVSLSPRLTSRPRSSVRHIYGSLQQESLVRKRHPIPPGNMWTSCNLPLPLDLGALEPGAFSLPTLSRPPTARSRTPSSRVTTPRNLFINLDNDVVDDSWNCVRARSMSPDMRSDTSSVGSLARQCCDVLGPRVCHDCTKIRARSTHGYHDTPLTSRLHRPERNLAVALLVAKALPSLSVDQIQTELNANKIVRPCFKTALSRRLQYEKERLEREKAAQAKRKTHTPSKTQKLAAEVKPSSKQDGVIKLAAKSFAELMYPTFVSPRKEKRKDSYFVAYYEPPVIPKACQNVEPAFFAGTDASYELPDRLPDELFAED
ncbi:hypothetical protein LSAT2_000192 [Lamellibrachia satsuma]|nr:hypothetical protein LSAT2_000192 [Lamellibrachia satsuma]